MALRITVIGTGYLGATHAAAMAELGFEVLGLDIVPEKVELLSGGRVPMYEPGLEEMLQRHVAGIEVQRAAALHHLLGGGREFGDVHFVCVNTPQKHGEYACDMSYVDSAFDALAPHLTRPALVVGKSTVPVGSAARLADRLAELAPAGAGAELAWNPEFSPRGLRRQGHPAPRPDRRRRHERERREAAPRGVRRADRRGLAVRRHRLPDRRAGQDLRQLSSSPPRSPSSTRWPRSARPPTGTS